MIDDGVNGMDTSVSRFELFKMTLAINLVVNFFYASLYIKLMHLKFDFYIL